MYTRHLDPVFERGMPCQGKLGGASGMLMLDSNVLNVSKLKLSGLFTGSQSCDAEKLAGAMSSNKGWAIYSRLFEA